MEMRNYMSEQDRIDQLLVDMLTENTGRHMLDSGGAYGRNWERNQGKTVEDFRKEPSAWPVWGHHDRLEYFIINVFHYLRGQLELDQFCNDFNVMSVDDWDSDYYGVSFAGETWLSCNDFEFNGVENTANHDSMLNQVLQYTMLERDGERYVLLQVHGGCDLRGGYTDAKLFKLCGPCGQDLGHLESEEVTIVINDVTYDLMGDDLIEAESGMSTDLDFNSVTKEDRVECWLQGE